MVDKIWLEGIEKERERSTGASNTIASNSMDPIPRDNRKVESLVKSLVARAISGGRKKLTRDMNSLSFSLLAWMKENWYRSGSNIPDPTFIARADTTFYSDPAAALTTEPLVDNDARASCRFRFPSFRADEEFSVAK